MKDLMRLERGRTEIAPDWARRQVLGALERELGLGNHRDRPREVATQVVATPQALRSATIGRKRSLARNVSILAAAAVCLVTGVGLGAVAGPSIHATLDRHTHGLLKDDRGKAEPTSRAASPVATPVAAPIVASNDLPAAPSSIDAVPAPSATGTPKAGPRIPVSPAANASSGDDARSRERTLLDRAQAALARRDLAAASEALDEHERAYPNGILAEERMFLRIQESLRAGRRAEAEARARTFRAKHPTSMLNPAVERLLSTSQ